MDDADAALLDLLGSDSVRLEVAGDAAQLADAGRTRRARVLVARGLTPTGTERLLAALWHPSEEHPEHHPLAALEILEVKGAKLRDLDPSVLGAIGRLPPALRSLSIAGSGLRALPDLRSAPGLEDVDLHDNLIGEELDRAAGEWLPPGVRTIDLSYNCLHRVRDWDAALPPEVAVVNLSFNMLTEPPPTRVLQAATVRFDHNNIEPRRAVLYVLNAEGVWVDPVTGERERDVAAAHARLAPYEPLAPLPTPAPEPKRNVYTHAQNVHGTRVQTGAVEAIARVTELTRDVPAPSSDADMRARVRHIAERLYPTPQKRGFFWTRGRRDEADNKKKRAELERLALDPAVYSLRALTYAQVLDRVWAVAELQRDEEVAATIAQRLREEIEEGSGMCFSGRVTRLVNALQGIVSDVHIGVSAREALQQRAVAVMRRLRDRLASSSREPPPDPACVALRRELLGALDDCSPAELPAAERAAWLDAFDEEVGYCPMV